MHPATLLVVLTTAAVVATIPFGGVECTSPSKQPSPPPQTPASILSWSERQRLKRSEMMVMRHLFEEERSRHRRGNFHQHQLGHTAKPGETQKGENKSTAQLGGHRSDAATTVRSFTPSIDSVGTTMTNCPSRPEGHQHPQHNALLVFDLSRLSPSGEAEEVTKAEIYLSNWHPHTTSTLKRGSFKHWLLHKKPPRQDITAATTWPLSSSSPLRLTLTDENGCSVHHDLSSASSSVRFFKSKTSHCAKDTTTRSLNPLCSSATIDVTATLKSKPLKKLRLGLNSSGAGYNGIHRLGTTNKDIDNDNDNIDDIEYQKQMLRLRSFLIQHTPILVVHTKEVGAKSLNPSLPQPSPFLAYASSPSPSTPNGKENVEVEPAGIRTKRSHSATPEFEEHQVGVGTAGKKDVVVMGKNDGGGGGDEEQHFSHAAAASTTHHLQKAKKRRRKLLMRQRREKATTTTPAAMERRQHHEQQSLRHHRRRPNDSRWWAHYHGYERQDSGAAHHLLGGKAGGGGGGGGEGPEGVLEGRKRTSTRQGSPRRHHSSSLAYDPSDPWMGFNQVENRFPKDGLNSGENEDSDDGEDEIDHFNNHRGDDDDNVVDMVVPKPKGGIGGKEEEAADEEGGEAGDESMAFSLLGSGGHREEHYTAASGGSGSGGGGGCRRKSWKVNFKELGWDEWVIAPKSFDAGYCAGSCRQLSKATVKSNHAMIQSILQSTGRYPHLPTEVCCAPASFDSLTLLYFDADQSVVLKNYPRMVVDSCGCL